MDPASTPSVLIVEDNLFNQKVFKLYLKKLGYDCDISVNGKEAVEAVKSKFFELILMDIQMPVLDGLEATRLIRDWEESNRPDQKTRIIAVTANTVNVNQEICREAGMDFYLKKPVGPTDLKKAIESVFL